MLSIIAILSAQRGLNMRNVYECLRPRDQNAGEDKSPNETMSGHKQVVYD